MKQKQKEKQLKYLSIDEWVNKMHCIHTMDHYLAIKRNEMLIHIITWTNLKSILSERSPIQCHTVYDSICIKYPEYANV